MKTVILCGGYGTRIRDVADDVPKPMVPIGGFPILWHIMKYYAHADYKDFVLCLGYKGRSIKEFFLNYQALTTDLTIELGSRGAPEYHGDHSEEGWRVTLAETGLKAMTGARLARVRKYLETEENFFLTYGDGVGDVDLRALLDFHVSHGGVMTVTGVRPPGRFGELEYGDGGVVSGFNEKPHVTGGRISAGFFVCRRDVFRYLDDREELVLEKDPFTRLVRDRQMMVFPHDGFWHPMDTSRDHSYLNDLCDKGEAPWMVW